MAYTNYNRSRNLSFSSKLFGLNNVLLLAIVLVCAIGILMLYSAGKADCVNELTCKNYCYHLGWKDKIMLQWQWIEQYNL